ncbi:hypothetical protein HC891_25145 [Candidatus Gracilibacteria bacterium]|nr:hypothetical protein [Candidatus Gracilibacteria bacterium]
MLSACDGIGSLQWGSYRGANRPLPDGLGLLYSANCIDDQRVVYRVDGFSMIYQFGFPATGHKSAAPAQAQPGAPPPGPLLYGYGFGSGPSYAHSVVHGHVRDPAIASVEVTFVDGQTYRDSPKWGGFLPSRSTEL